MERRNWSREELILAFNLYCTIPYGTFHGRNPKVIELANLIGRTPNSLALKLSNFASFDPYHKARGIKGLQNVGRLDREIWDEFTNNWDALIFENEKILAAKQKTTLEKKYLLEDLSAKKGEHRISEVKVRINQNFFRNAILSIYNFRCAISGIDIPDLLIASHIIPWSHNEKERLNPRNGICFSPLYDSCFDKGYIGITQEYRLAISQELKSNMQKEYFMRHFGFFEKREISLPDRFLPEPAFLDYHYQNIFRK
ncbi:MAG: HNH endonuclease [Thermodesulfovibrionales bacterium]|jgi:putative restriction endonuclease